MDSMDITKRRASLVSSLCGGRDPAAAVERERASGHTPTPWSVEERRKVGDFFIADDEGNTIGIIYRSRYVDERNDPAQKANADLIVRAVNSHAELVAVLRAICDYCNVKQAKPGDSYNIPADGVLLANARAALAKATA